MGNVLRLFLYSYALVHPLKTIFSPNFLPERWGCSSEEESSGSKVLMSGSLCQRRLTVENRCWGHCGIVGASPKSGRRKLGFRRLSGKEGKVFGIGSSCRCTSNSSGNFARVAEIGSVSSIPTAWLGSLTYWLSINIIYRFQGFRPFQSRFCP